MTTTKVLSREKLMAKIQKAYPDMFLRTTEEFDGSKGGIWTSGEDGIFDKKGFELFDYYAGDYTELNYVFGVRKHFYDFLKRNGWYAQWHDAGTIMFYEG
jgi:hypothetical protein